MSSKHMWAIAVVALMGLGVASAAQTKPLLQSAPKKTAPAPAAKTPAKPAAPKTTIGKTTPAATAPAQSSSTSDAGSLESVLDQLDQASADFKSTEADFVWEQYQKVVDETDTQKGKIFFLRRDKETTNMAANVVEPDKKDLVYADGK
ncbi:MAG: hypothetical protein ABIP81_04075, partial [Terriglobales bacterium]